MDHESPEVIEREMEATRTSLTDKVAALEQQVMGTIQNASDTVSNIVDTVKHVVPETLTSVKDTLTESVEEVSARVRSAFDLSSHVREHPWAMVGGATALGFMTGLLVFRGRSEPSFTRLAAAASPPPHAAPASTAPPLGATPAAPRRPSWLDDLMDRVGRELLAVGETAIASAAASLKQTVQEGLPKLIGPEGLGLDGRRRESDYPRPTEAERMRDQRPL
ncbi:MAG TPA: DUF883 C-terminal domain-containing protein [Fimbriiglobus sp.]|nr:DUF883 C-terminal domain-containing protein [Fimbriiglobus sp.]